MFLALYSKVNNDPQPSLITGVFIVKKTTLALAACVFSFAVMAGSAASSAAAASAPKASAPAAAASAPMASAPASTPKQGKKVRKGHKKAAAASSAA